MKSLDYFLPNIRMYAPGVADPTAFFAARQAAIEFCERTRLWKFEDSFIIAADDNEALLSPPNSVVHEIENVWFNGSKLEAKTNKQLDDLLPAWRSGDVKPTGTPSYVTQTEPNTIILMPLGAGTVKLSLILKPSQDAVEVPDFLADQHRETIAFGALARILLIPNQSFSNPEMGGAFGSAFSQRMDGKSNAGIIGQQKARVRVKASFY